MLLPTYDVFDESRYFHPAEKQQVLEFQGQQLGVTICEDAWNDEIFGQIAAMTATRLPSSCSRELRCC